MSIEYPPLIAHRGNALEFPENTLPSFQSALQLGARFVELDVQLARDGVPMVLHDGSLVRTTGQSGNAWDYDAAALRQIAAAEASRFGATYHDTLLPDLAAVLTLMNRWPDATLFVEIKTESIEQFGHQKVVRAVLDVLARQPGRWAVISFDHEAVQWVRELSGLPIGWVLTRYDAASAHRASTLAPDYLFCNWKKLPATEPLWTGPWKWCCYEVREAALAMKLLARGVDLIETMAVRDMSTALQVAGTGAQ